MTVSLRPARPDDVAQMLEIEEASFSDPWSAASFAGYLSDSNAGRALVTVAEAAGHIIGYSVMLFALPDADLANIAVAPAARGKGTGRLLLDRSLAAARSLGTQHVYLEVRASNEPAIRMYESVGFAEFGVRRRYYRDPVEDARVLRLDLAPH
jgi:ribosomal-protein-alanine N-acetyltransferase